MFIINEQIRKMYKMLLNAEKTILKRAIKEFKNITGMDIKYAEHRDNKTGYDVELHIQTDNKELTLRCEIKARITKNNIGQIIYRFNNTGIILIVRQVTNEIATELKKANIQFMDTAGNAYINAKPIFVYVKGNRIKQDILKPKPIRVFQKTGLKVLFVILSKPEIINEPLRNIAYAADTALGTVAYIFEDLKKLGYLYERKKPNRKLINRDELIKKWVENYNEILRPTIIRGRYTTNKVEWWKDVNPGEVGIYWGGEVGANLVTKYLKPDIKTIYTEQSINKLILKNKLLKDKNGDVEILDKFWHFNYEEEWMYVVPPILMYADLVRIPDQRNHETAVRIYEQYILKLINKD
jgi:hypothetical protein